MARNKKQQYNHKPKKFSNQFKINDIISKLNTFNPMAAYSFSKRNQPNELTQVLSFLPSGYVTDLNDKIQSADFIYSGSTEQPYILGILVGRLDTFQGKETFDTDLFHIAPEADSVDDYFMKQYIHIKDENGNRISTILNSSLYSSSLDRENQLYNTYLTGSTTCYTFEDYQNEKPDFLTVFKNNFK